MQLIPSQITQAQSSGKLRCRTRLFCFLAVIFFLRPALAEDWLQWGGPKGDFTVQVTGLADTWPEHGPKQLWKRPLGDGYSAILFEEGQLYTSYSEGDHEVVISLNAATGATNWEHRYLRKLWPDMREYFGPGPNATPLIIGDRIVSVGISGSVRCLDLKSGKLLWKHELTSEFGRKKRVEEYGYSSSPLIYKNNIIVQVGGDNHGVIALDVSDGSILWKGEPGSISYAGPSLIQLAGKDQYIYFSQEGVNGLDPDTGRLLWHSPIEFANGNHLTPIVKCDDNHIWVSSQFTSGGGRLLEITRQNHEMKVNQKWFQPKLRGSCWTSIRIGDYVYGSVGGHNTSFLAAAHWKTGKIAWRKRGFHMAQCLYADEKLILLDDDGKLSMAKVSPKGFDVLASFQVANSRSWTVPTLVSTKLYIRNRKDVMAFDLAE